MAKVETKEIQNIGMFMQDFWKYTKEFWEPEKEEPYWEALCIQANKLIKKYPHEFSKAMCIAFLNYLEDEYKRMEVNSNA